MAKEGLKPALAALKELAGRVRLYWGISPNILTAANFEDAIHECGWDTTLDENGDLQAIQWDWEKAGDELAIFQAIAPWVLDGSWIEMLGEGGERWRWVFENGECREVKATISWGIISLTPVAKSDQI